jgi:hypothetical protein
LTTLQLESWGEFYPDAKFLFPLHWKELALNHAHIELDCDVEGYSNLEKLGRLLILSARSDGKLVGYITCFLMHHLHYKSSGLMALTDMYFVLPEFRHGTGVCLFLEWERILRERKVIQAITSCKVHQDHSKLFSKLGWTHSDNTFVKVLCQ